MLHSTSIFRCLLLLAFYLSAYKSSAQDKIITKAHFQHITMSDGLSNSWVSDIHLDSNGFIWIATQYGLNRLDGSQIYYYTYDPSDTSSLSNNWVMTIAEDQGGTLWLGTYGSGLNSYNPRTKKIKRLFYDNKEPNNNHINRTYTSYLDHSGNLWMGSISRYVLKYDTKNDLLVNIEDLSGVYLLDVAEDPIHIWFATDKGLYGYNKKEDTIYKSSTIDAEIRSIAIEGSNLLIGSNDCLISLPLNGHELIAAPDTLVKTTKVNDIEVSGQMIWLATAEGLIAHSLNSGESGLYIHDASQPTSLLEGELLSLEEDREGNLWIGGQKGLCVLYKDQGKFEFNGYHPEIKKHRGVRSITSTKDYIWIGADDGCWSYSKYDHHKPPRQILKDPIRRLLSTSSGNIFASTLNSAGLYTGIQISAGLYKIDQRTFRTTRYLPDPDDQQAMSQGIVWSMQEDRDSGIIISAGYNLNYLPNNADHFVNLNELIPEFLRDSMIYITMCLDHRDRLWLGLAQGGIRRITWRYPNRPFTKEEIKTYKYDHKNPGSVSTNIIQYILEDQSGTIWVCTDGGFNRYNEASDNFTRYTRSSGLIDDKLIAAAEDKEGRIWMSTISHGLLVWDIQSHSSTYYREADGIYHDAFLLHAAHVTKEGIMLFANERGVQVFDPSDVKLIVEELPPVYFTGLKLNNKEITVDDKSILSSAPEFTSDLNLSYRQNNLTFSYALPHYNHSDKFKYKYQLKGATNDWIPIAALSDISFVNLNPGDYTLTVEACLMNQCQTSQPLSIHIRPPVWASKWAYLLYLILMTSVLYWFYRHQIKRKLEKQKQLHREEIHEAKTRFFANITHEFRTPLTLISGPLDRLLSSALSKDHKVKNVLQGIKKNASHLLTLVNNVLDISRLESGLIPVNLINTKVQSYTRSIIDNFQSYAQSRSVEIVFIEHGPDFETMMDRDKLQIILSNLLSNAIKFSGVGNTIAVLIDYDENQYHLTVSDQGQGISQTDLTKIYDRFFRVGDRQIEGTGLGLSLVKDLVGLLNGHIKVKSQLHLGTAFTVSLPLIKVPAKDASELNTHKDKQNILAEKDHDKKSHVVLFVEDNDEVAEFVMEGLKDHYIMIRCADGKKGYLKAIEIVPDVIISDVMMPEMDGFTLCNKIKSHPITDHIPVLLLTARADTASKLEGMVQGADAYLVKPFNDEELRLVIANTIRSRRNLLAKVYSGAKAQKIKDEVEEHPFICSLKSLIHEEMNSPQFNVEFICKKMGTSRTQLHRKVKALTDQSTIQLVNDIKLNKAVDLLRKSELTISEIAYECGFSDPAYFSQAFSKRFGCSASQFRQKEVKHQNPSL